MFSVIKAKQLILQNTHDITEDDRSKLKQMANDDVKKTGIKTTINKTESMFVELNELLDNKNTLDISELQIANRIRKDTKTLLKNLSKLQKACSNI